MPRNPTLTELFAKNPNRQCSLEVSYNRPVSLDVLSKIKFKFCSVMWLGSFSMTPEQIAPLMLAKDLITAGYTVILHLPARSNTKGTLMKTLDYAKHIGIRNLLCVRGSSPECNNNESEYDFPHVPQLIQFIKSKYGEYFDLLVVGFPCMHPDSASLEEDMKSLKQKYHAGAKFIVAQAALTYDVYKRFLGNIRKHGINLPIIPGVYVINSSLDFALLKKICNLKQDNPILDYLKEHKGRDEEIAAYGMKISRELVLNLLQDTDFLPPHVFSMNEFRVVAVFLSSIHSGFVKS